MSPAVLRGLRPPPAAVHRAGVRSALWGRRRGATWCSAGTTRRHICRRSVRSAKEPPRFTSTSSMKARRGRGPKLMNRCLGTKRDNSPCTVSVEPPQIYCWWHDPANADARRRAASKGGKRGGRGRPIAELVSLRDENADIRRRLLEGELLPNVAAVAVQSINTDIRAVGVVLKAREQEELVDGNDPREASGAAGGVGRRGRL